jgi:L-alanine-DL-glutamate epimerase-like enolase superfamily enzyme
MPFLDPVRGNHVTKAAIETACWDCRSDCRARYWAEDIEPPVTFMNRGTIVPPSGPGIGFWVKRDRIEALTMRSKTIEA